MATSPFETSSHGHVIKACRARAARQEKLLGILSPLRISRTSPGLCGLAFLLSDPLPVSLESPDTVDIPVLSSYLIITSA